MIVKLPFLVLLILFFLQTRPPTTSKIQPQANKISANVIKQRDDCAAKIENAKAEARRDAENKYNNQISEIRKRLENKSGTADSEATIKQLRGELAGLKKNYADCQSESIATNSCCKEGQSYKAENANLRLSQSAELAKLSKIEKDRYDNLVNLFNLKTAENSNLLKIKKNQQSIIDAFTKIPAIKTNENAALIKKAENVESESKELESKSKAESATTPLFCKEEVANTLLAADEITDKTTTATADQFRTITADGKMYEVRELMIGTLLFPTEKDLVKESGQPLDIKVIFKPNALLRNQKDDGRIKWYLEVKFVPDKIENFRYDEAQSKAPDKRVVGDDLEEEWIWKIDKMPDNFSTDKSKIQIDGSVEIDDREISKRTVANEDIVIKNAPGFLASAFTFFQVNLTALLAIVTSAFGLGIAYLGYGKAVVDKEKSQIEMELLQEKARNEALQHQIEKSGEAENSIESHADSIVPISSVDGKLPEK
jgi:hypothetical protein